VDSYAPGSYILPRTYEEGLDLYRLLQESPDVKTLVFEEKRVTLGAEETKRLLYVALTHASDYRRFIERVAQLPQIKALYNTELLHIQQYLFRKLRVAPTSKVEVQFDDETKKLRSIRLIDDLEEVAPPPFTVLLFTIHTNPSIVTQNPRSDPITCIEVKDHVKQQLQGDEQTILQQFESIVQNSDPDCLVCPELRNTVSYLFERAKCLNLNLNLGREATGSLTLGHPLPDWFRGRIVLDYGFFADYGIAGLMERARFGVLPPGLAAVWTANRVIDSRNCFELLNRNYVIPQNRGGYEYTRTLGELVLRDRGSLIISPHIGIVHENVAELDFESQYPNLIVSEGLSYETVTPTGIVKSVDAILPQVTKWFLTRRLYFKRLKKKYEKESLEWQWCEQRQLALKAILVTLYGTSGCCWNRFANVLCFEEINRCSREVMLRTKDIVQTKGFEVVYGDTDSIFVKKNGASKDDYEEVCQEINRHTGLPIALDHYYKYLLFLPLESDPLGNMEAQKHYFGILTTGEILARGIELRRHDCPPFVKDFQERLIHELFHVETVKEVSEVGYQNAVNYILDTLKRVMKGKVPITELVVSKVLRRPLSEYTRLFPHVSAAVNLARYGRSMKEGETIDFLFVNADHPNPLRRVVPVKLIDGGYYDREKYSEMILDAAETVLSTFGFSRQKIGFNPSIRSFNEMKR